VVAALDSDFERSLEVSALGDSGRIELQRTTVPEYILKSFVPAPKGKARAAQVILEHSAEEKAVALEVACERVRTAQDGQRNNVLNMAAFLLGRRGDRLRLRAPVGAVDPDLLGEVRDHKTELLSWLANVENLLNMPVSEFERQGNALELRVRWWEETLWLVPCASHVEILVRQGIVRGRIWMVRELADFLAAPGLTRDDIKKMVHLKLAFGAVIINVLPDVGDAKKHGDA